MIKKIACALTTCFFLSSHFIFGADVLLSIQTNEGKFTVSKNAILEGPDGYLRNLCKNLEKMTSTLRPDGSLFVDVTGESMRIALSYIRHNHLDKTSIRSSAVIRRDLEFLFPQLAPLHGRRWKCSAYCFNYTSRFEYAGLIVTTSHRDIFDAWKELDDKCKALATYNDYYFLSYSTDNEQLKAASFRKSCMRQ